MLISEYRRLFINKSHIKWITHDYTLKRPTSDPPISNQQSLEILQKWYTTTWWSFSKSAKFRIFRQINGFNKVKGRKFQMLASWWHWYMHLKPWILAFRLHICKLLYGHLPTPSIKKTYLYLWARVLYTNTVDCISWCIRQQEIYIYDKMKPMLVCYGQSNIFTFIVDSVIKPKWESSDGP